jgi:hypothetical protein
MNNQHHVEIFITNRPTATHVDPDLIVAYDSYCPCEIWVDDKLKYKTVKKQ